MCVKHSWCVLCVFVLVFFLVVDWHDFDTSLTPIFSQAHQKRCLELGVFPVPMTVDDCQIDEDALAKQCAVAKDARITDTDSVGRSMQSMTSEEGEGDEEDAEEEDADEDEEEEDQMMSMDRGIRCAG